MRGAVEGEMRGAMERFVYLRGERLVLARSMDRRGEMYRDRISEVVVFCGFCRAE